MSEDIAIAHKDYDVLGGGELVAEHLAQAFDATLYVGYHDPDLERDVDPQEIDTGRLSAWLRNRSGLQRSVGHMLGWMQADELTDYDVVITSGNEPRWYTPTDGQTVVAYTHSPPRWMYDLHHRYDDSFGGRLGQAVTMAQRSLFHHTTDFPDLYVANSDIVARRIRRYYNAPAERVRTVYPPVDVSTYGRDIAETGDYYVTVGRLDAAKHVSEVVEAFNHRDDRLVVAGDGPERGAIESQAEKSVVVAGYVSEREKRSLLSGAKAFVFAGANEDFCMSTVEALASGTPVITVDEGFPPYQIGAHVGEGLRGYTFERGKRPGETVKNLHRAVERFESEGVLWSSAAIESFADRFSVDRFADDMHDAVEMARSLSDTQPRWDESELDATGVITDVTPAAESAVTDGGDA